MFSEMIEKWSKGFEKISFLDFKQKDVNRVLSKEKLEPIDLSVLLSPAAKPFLEVMAQKANRLTLRHFGRAVTLFTPLYLANYCTNQCIYCSFNYENDIIRRRLTLAEVKEEGKAIAATGLQHLLLLTGESRKESSPKYMEECVKLLRNDFSSIGIEVYPLEEDEYQRLCEAGVDTLTIYQEVYDKDIYAKVHPVGPKRNYQYRLDAPERACRGGISGVTIGALLGLGEWRKEALFTAIHADYLQKKYPSVEIGVSAPRLRPHVGSFKVENPITDEELVQVLLAYRLYLPRVGITLSTREKANFRDALIPLGITKMSAGSLTSVGGYSDLAETGSPQFDIADDRSVEEITELLRAKGYQPVFCDWVNFRERKAE